MMKSITNENFERTGKLRFAIELDGELAEQFLRRKQTEHLDKNATLGKKLIALELERGEVEAAPVTA